LEIDITQFVSIRQIFDFTGADPEKTICKTIADFCRGEAGTQFFWRDMPYDNPMCSCGTQRTVLDRILQISRFPQLPQDHAQSIALPIGNVEQSSKLGLFENHPLIGHSLINQDILIANDGASIPLRSRATNRLCP